MRSGNALVKSRDDPERPRIMTYKSSFQDRAAQAAKAKQEALEQYRVG